MLPGDIVAFTAKMVVKRVLKDEVVCVYFDKKGIKREQTFLINNLMKCEE